MKVHEFVLKAMQKAMCQAVTKNEIIIGDNIKTSLDFDEFQADRLLENLAINKGNVLRYLPKKYKPTFAESGIKFKDVACIQQAVITDKNLTVLIHNSEPHKILTDTFYILQLLDAKGYKYIKGNINYKIDLLKINSIDLLIYVEILKKYGYSIPAGVYRYTESLLTKYDSLFKIVKIKKKSIRRKYLRYYAAKGWILWNELRLLMNIYTETDEEINHIIEDIKFNSRIRGNPFTR